MNSVLDTIFGLREVSFADPDAVFELVRRPEPWLLGLIAAVLVGVAVWSYMRAPVPRGWRWSLAAVRACILLLVALLLAGPQLVVRTTTTEDDWVVVLLDRSASLAVEDLPGSASRDDQLIDTLGLLPEQWSGIEESKRFMWLGFDAWTRELATAQLRYPTADSIGSPEGRASAIGAALEQALARAAARPVSGVVLFSDGRSTDTIPRRVLQRLENERIPVFAVGLGSEARTRDFAVARIDAPSTVFEGDVVPFRVNVAIRAEDISAAGDAKVELVDSQTGQVLDTAPLEPASSDQEVTLLYRATDAGSRRLVARLVSDDGDLIAANDELSHAMDVVDRPLRVLYLDGYPRWEHRYIKNLLRRERTIESASLLVAPNRGYIQDGDIELASIPRSPEEWAEFDVVVLGDLRGDLLGETQMAQLRDHVADRGGGLLWIAGPGATPQTWRGTPLADLLPFTPPTDGGADGVAWNTDVTLAPTPTAERLGLLNLVDPSIDPALAQTDWSTVSDPATGWSRLRFCQRIAPEQLKAATQVLAGAFPASGGEPSPAVVSMPFGAGISMYVATDEIWRWRYARGEALPERFWLPLLRHIGRQRLRGAANPVVLSVVPETPLVGQPASVVLELFDQAVAESTPSRVNARIVPINTLGEEGEGVAFGLGTTGADEPGRVARTGLWTPDEPGEYILRVREPGLSVDRRVRVTWSDAEQRDPWTDHDTLRSLADRTGGAFLTPDEVGEIPSKLPNRQRVLAGASQIETLWDKAVVLITLVSLLTFEWIARRLLRVA